MTFAEWLATKRNSNTGDLSRELGFEFNTVQCWLYRDAQPRFINLIEVVRALAKREDESIEKLWNELLICVIDYP